MGIVERVNQKCAELNTNKATLEKELGFGNGTINRWRERVPGVDRVLLLANKLNVSVEWLITGKEPGELTQEEQKLVDLYRGADERGRRTIMSTAEREVQELESSTSTTG